MTIMEGKSLSEQIKNDLKPIIKSYMIKPCLAVIQVGDDSSSNIYVKAKEKACNEVGIYFKHIKYTEEVREKEIINKIVELNNDDYVNGILLQLPLPSKYNTEKLINYIARNKDVDGLTDVNAGKLINNKKCLVSCTPQAIMEILKNNKIELEGKNVVIVGRSNLVGKPLASLMLNNNATVTICHSKTVNLKNHTINADILISAVGKKHFITADMVKNDAIVIDVGITREDDKLYGDVDFDNVKNIASYITPVPGGVGPVTVSMLLNNVNECYKKMNTSK